MHPALPRLVHLRASADPSRDCLQSLIDYTLAEARQPRPGGQCVVVRLGELMFVEESPHCIAVIHVAGNDAGAGEGPVVGAADGQYLLAEAGAQVLKGVVTGDTG